MTIHPIQPYFAISADKYHKRPMSGDGIAHLYEYRCGTSDNDTMLVIPDGSIDVMFDTTSEDLSAKAAGTVLAGTKVPMKQGHIYFGIRFEPGVMPAFLDGSFHDLVDADVDLAACTRDRELTERIRSLTSFQERADYFTQYYRGYLCQKEEVCLHPDQKSLFAAVRDRIQESGGRIMIRDLEDYTGYSSRYIGKIFQTYLGMSPKKFASIVRFQKAIDHLDHDNEITFSDLAADYGYYDQPQFIRDFRKYAGTTPREYRRQIIDSDYTDKFIVE